MNISQMGQTNTNNQRKGSSNQIVSIPHPSSTSSSALAVHKTRFSVRKTIRKTKKEFTTMRSRGPSPLVPSLMVGVLGLVILGPTLLSVLEFVLPLFLAGDSDSSSGGFYLVMIIVLLSLLVLVQLLSVFFPTLHLFTGSFQQTGSSAFDDGFGLGTILLVVLFLVLYNFW